jgi:CRP/FNR family cyclic AMP-dependent transcriptional regulator
METTGETVATEIAVEAEEAPRKLSGVALFDGLTPEEITEVEGMVSWHVVPEGEIVFDQESDTLEVYCVVQGGVRILTTMAGREVVLAEIRSGNFFGEIAAIDGKPRTARVMSIEDSLLASISGQTFIELMMKFPRISIRVMERLARVIRALDTRVTSLSTLSDEQRVVIELLRLAEPDPKVPNSWHIAVMPVHSDIASWAGTEREVVARTIGMLARESIVKRRGIGLIIADWNQMQKLGRSSGPRD